MPKFKSHEVVSILTKVPRRTKLKIKIAQGVRDLPEASLKRVLAFIQEERERLRL